MSIYNPGLSRREPSAIARAAAAKDAADARHADRTDPHRNLIRRVRAETLALATVTSAAALEWEYANKPVSLPAGAGSAELHPTRVAAIAKLMAEQGWSDNPREPCIPVPSLADVTEAVAAETRQRLDDAQAALIAFEEERRREALGLDDEDQEQAATLADALAGETGESETKPDPAPKRRPVEAVDLTQLGDID